MKDARSRRGEQHMDEERRTADAEKNGDLDLGELASLSLRRHSVRGVAAWRILGVRKGRGLFIIRHGRSRGRRGRRRW